MVKDFQEQTQIGVCFVFSSIAGEFTHLSPNCHFLCKTEKTRNDKLKSFTFIVELFFFLYSKVLDTLLKRNSRFPPHLVIQHKLQSSRCKQSEFPLVSDSVMYY